MNTKDPVATSRRAIRAVVGAALLAVGLSAGLAQAQWAWKDANGNTVFSDRAPPSDIKPSQIIRRPGGVRTSGEAPSYSGASAPASAPGAASAVKPKTTAEREADFRRRQAEAASGAKAAADAEANKKQLNAACDRSRNYLKALESGQRISTGNDKGEQVAMEDAERNKEMARVRKEVADSCK